MSTTPTGKTSAPGYGSHPEQMDEGADMASRLEAAMGTVARVLRTVEACTPLGMGS